MTNLDTNQGNRSLNDLLDGIDQFLEAIRDGAYQRTEELMAVASEHLHEVRGYISQHQARSPDCNCQLPRRAIVPEEHDDSCPVVQPGGYPVMGGVRPDAESSPQRVAHKDDNLASPQPACSEISVVDDFRDTISNALECANLFVLKHCDKPKAVEVIQAINAGRDALRLHKPVSVSLKVGATAMHNYAYTNDLSERDGFIQEEYMDNAKACAEAWGLSWKN